MITDESIQKWEPKIQQIIYQRPILGMDKEDVAQELRIIVWKSLQKYQAGHSSGANFHTYVHQAMVNRLITLRKRENGRYKVEIGLRQSREALPLVTNSSSFSFLVDQLHLTYREQSVLELLLEGYTAKEVAPKLGFSASTVNHMRAAIGRKYNLYLRSVE